MPGRWQCEYCGLTFGENQRDQYPTVCPHCVSPVGYEFYWLEDGQLNAGALANSCSDVIASFIFSIVLSAIGAARMIDALV